MNKKGSILVVDDNKSILTTLQLLLEPYFENVVVSPTPHTIRHTLATTKVDVVLLDMNFEAGLNTGNEGLFFLREIKKWNPQLPVVLFTAYADIELAVAGIKEGAFDFVVKPWDNEKLLQTLMSAASCEKRKAESSNFPLANQNLFWGNGRRMEELRTLAQKVAPTDASILISGENGTGKTLLANEIHSLSDRRDKAMVVVDLGSLSESLFESELFGHVKGAFTDARSDRAGKIEEADGSTLFLDEIGNLAFPLQAKLLTVLQNKTVTRVGSNKSVPVNFRLICATNRNLRELVLAGRFREDLYYRINTIHCEIPPLRERPEDIVPLAESLIHRFAAKYHKPLLTLTTAAKDKLKCHVWNGNIRELEHSVEKAVILCDGSVIDAELFALASPLVSSVSINTLDEMEMTMIASSIARHAGNLSAVASELGIARQTLYNKMKKYGL